MDVAGSKSSQLAMELPRSLDWLNLPHPLRLSALRGRLCALAFVNAGSSWSLQRLHDLARLQARHGERLQVVAVHVPRFDHERDSARIVQRLGRHEFGFPIAHDVGWMAWQQYGIEAWPTVVLIDGNGVIRESVVGHGLFHELDAQVTRLMRELAEVPAPTDPIELRSQPHTATALRYPIGLAVSGNYLYVADSGHHRVLECDHAGRILRQFGTGRADLLDGPAETAAFRRPHGLCLQRGALYVADSGNHAIRRIDLRSGEVLTLLGSGQPGPTSPGLVPAPGSVTLDHPRAMAVAGDALLIATSGDNRIWQYDLGTRSLQVAAGSGELAVNDGTGEEAAFAEPVALAAVQQLVYVCDGAGSAIRSLNIRNRQVATLVGQDPWNHGHADGARSEALLQDPQAIALDPDAPMLWIADCGNDLLRTLRLGGGELETYPLPRPLHGPSGLAVADGVVWIADTDAHAVLRLEPRAATLHHVPIGE
jgi:streptogramin lyase